MEWTEEKRNKMSEVVKKSWEEHHDERVEGMRNRDTRKYDELKDCKQTTFGTGIRDAEGYRDYMRGVQRIYRAERPEIMAYYRKYRYKQRVRTREERIRAIQTSLTVRSVPFSRYVITEDGRFFRITNGQEAFPDRYIEVQGRRYNIEKLIRRLFGALQDG